MLERLSGFLFPSKVIESDCSIADNPEGLLHY